MPAYRPAGFLNLNCEVETYIGRARVTGSGKWAGCIVIDVSKMSEAATFSLGGVLEGRGGWNVRRIPPYGKAQALIAHATKPTSAESLEEER